MDLSLFFLVFMVSQSFLHFSWGGGVTLSGVALCVYIHILVISKTPLLTKASLVIPQEHQRRRRRCRAGERLKVR